jgi:hypothetical protein
VSGQQVVEALALAADTLAEPGKRAARLAPQQQRAGAEGCDPGSVSVRAAGIADGRPGLSPNRGVEAYVEETGGSRGAVNNLSWSRLPLSGDLSPFLRTSST